MNEIHSILYNFDLPMDLGKFCLASCGLSCFYDTFTVGWIGGWRGGWVGSWINQDKTKIELNPCLSFGAVRVELSKKFCKSWMCSYHYCLP